MIVFVDSVNIMFNPKKEIRNLQYDILRRYFVLSSAIAFASVWSFYALLQSDLIKLSQLNINQMQQLAEILALASCLCFAICGFILLFQEKSAKLKNNTKKDKIRYICEKYVNKVDFSGSLICFIMQFLSVSYMLSIIYWSPSQYLENKVFNGQIIVETIGSSLFVISAIMSLTITLCKENNNISKKDKAINDKQKAASLGIFIGSSLMFIGKILVAFEAKNQLIYSGAIGQLGIDKIPIGLILRIVGMITFIAAFSISISSKYKELQNHASENKNLTVTNHTQYSNYDNRYATKY